MSRFEAWIQWLYATAAPQPGAGADRLRLAHHVLLDFVAVCCGTIIASIVLKGSLPTFSWVSVSRFALIQSSFFTLIGYSEGLYQNTIPAQDELRLAGKCCFFTILLSAISQTAALAFSLLATVSGLLLAFGCRSWGRWRLKRRTPGLSCKNTLIVGSGPAAQKVAQYLRANPGENRAVVGFVDDCAGLANDVRGRIQDIPHITKTRFVDEIIVAVSQPDALRAINLAQSCSLDIQIVPELFGFASSTHFQRFGDIPVIALQEERPLELGLFAKRVLDVALAAVAMTLSMPLLGIIAAAIRLDSVGPVLYAAERVGFKGRRFRCYKFRTMIVDADGRKEALRTQNERCGASFKLENDPRITRVGHWLRRYSLDELPQLWNVIKGEMSLVGPRPHPLDDFARYDVDDLRRLEAIPGLTGLWQVSARKDPSFKLNVELDREYIEHWSLKTDLKIMLKTVSAVLQGTGS